MFTLGESSHYCTTLLAHANDNVSKDSPCYFRTKCQLMKFELEFHFAYSHDDLSQKSEKITVHFLLFMDYCSLVLFIMTFYAYLRRDFP